MSLDRRLFLKVLTTFAALIGVRASAPASAGETVPDWCPPGYLPRDGRAVSRHTYRELFEHIGTEYGAGDGVATFNIPGDCPAWYRHEYGEHGIIRIVTGERVNVGQMFRVCVDADKWPSAFRIIQSNIGLELPRFEIYDGLVENCRDGGFMTVAAYRKAK